MTAQFKRIIANGTVFDYDMDKPDDECRAHAAKVMGVDGDTLEIELLGCFVIQDWTSKRMFPDQTFETFDDGWAFLYESFPTDDDSDGFYDDFFVVPATND